MNNVNNFYNNVLIFTRNNVLIDSRNKFINRLDAREYVLIDAKNNVLRYMKRIKELTFWLQNC